MDASSYDASTDASSAAGAEQRQAQLSSIVSYLANLLPLLLSASQIDLQNSVLNPADRAQYAGPLLLRFANEPSLQSIYINKHTVSTSSLSKAKQQQLDVEGLEHEETADDTSTSTGADKFAYTITTSLSWHSNNVASLALIKRVPTLDTSRSLSDQLHFINLFGPAITSSSALAVDGNAANGAKIAEDAQDGTRTAGAGAAATAASSNPYESLHSIVHLAVQPYFDAYVSRKTASFSTNNNSEGLGDNTNGADGALVKKGASSTSNNANSAQDSANTGIPVAKKKFAELELSLLHLQQNVEIPEIVLGVHPVVLRAVEKAHLSGARLSAQLIEPASLLSDDSFLNKVQSEVNQWVKEIQSITKLSRSVESGTASQEINFWLSMEKALENIQEQLRSDPIVLTLDILKNAKRFHATVSFIADTGLKESFDKVLKYNLLMKDFPLNDLLSSTDNLDKINESLINIFNHLNKKLKLSPYPIRRALPLVEAISKDLSDAIIKVLNNTHRLMYSSYTQFDLHTSTCMKIFATWDELLKEFTNVAREVTRKRAEKFIPIKINAWHTQASAGGSTKAGAGGGGLQGRIEYLRNFRKHHQQLVSMVSPTKGVIDASATDSSAIASNIGGLLGGLDMEHEVRMAWEEVKNVDILDTSEEGTQIWITAETAYNERVARVENQIIARLRDRLGTARNATEMFRIFSRFNALFVRPKIRGAIQEYQTTLIESVKEDITSLHLKFRSSYKNSQSYQMSQLRDISPIAGAIIWAKQIERQLNTYMKRVEDVLGKGWELYAEGAKLASESTSFKRKLDTRPIYEAWLHEINRRDMRIEGRLFDITKSRSTLVNGSEALSPGLVNGDGEYLDGEGGHGANGHYTLAINFDPQIITLFKEVRNLLWLGFSVPHAIGNIAKDAKRVYPYAVSLMETIRTYSQTLGKANADPEILPLIVEYRREVQSLISKGMSLRWEYFVNTFDSRQQIGALLPPGSSLSNTAAADLTAREGRHGAFVRELASAVSIFQDRTDALLDMHAEISESINGLATCGYSRTAFQERLAAIQKVIDRLNLEGYANLDSWVLQLDKRIEEALLLRLKDIIELWCTEFAKDAEGRQASKPATNGVNGHAKSSDYTANILIITPVKHELRIRNQTIYLDPPIEHAKQEWYSQLQTWLGVVCNLTRIKGSNYELGLKASAQSAEETQYVRLLGLLNSDELRKPFAIIEDRFVELSQYVNKWLEFQALWDLEAEYVYNRLGDNLSDWQQLLLEIRKTRATFDTSEVHHDLGVAIINYDQVQAKVNAKYDSWQRDILGRFGQKLGNAMRETHRNLLKSRHDLEHHSIETSSTAQAVALITFIQDLKRKVKKWEPEIEIYSTGQATLERQRYQFPGDWLYIDQLEVEWNSFNDILGRKNSAIQEQFAGLQLKILAEDKIVQNKIAEAAAEWEENKPIQGHLKAEDAMTAIGVYESRINQLHEQADMVAKAKEALELESAKDERLTPVIEEIRDLKAVWTALSGVWSQIHDMADTLWSNVQPRKLRQQLDTLLASTREMPSRMRQYAAFEYVQDLLRQRLKANAIVGDLKSEALRERHWRQLFKVLRIASAYMPSSMTLGGVWEFDLKRNEGLVKEVIVQAQGEMALEEFLKQVKETWVNYSLELVNYQNKTRLVKGWDDLFAKCSENLNSLSAMKLSPYYKVFEEEALTWEDRLNRIHVLFDVWIDVQRQWVYLEGIFSGSADIKHLLPVESARFSSINSEFLTVMKKVFKSPFVLDVLNIQGIQKSLERLAELLSKIQKALGEYLERERASFPRFYFVGDEDLLEIIGNSKDIHRIGKHLKKMFAGLSTLLFDNNDEPASIVGLASREGEEVKFVTPIEFAQHPRINDWLAKLESEMKNSLAALLVQSHQELSTLLASSDTLDKDAFIAWIDTYPSQLVVLTMQIMWTTQVEEALSRGGNLTASLDRVMTGLDILADVVLGQLHPMLRSKCENLVTELVHQRDVIRSLQTSRTTSPTAFEWTYHMRFYLNTTTTNPLHQVQIQMADAVFHYGFEYLGVADRLVQTPLTDRCYLTLTQALSKRLGGSPFGPAGTGKTESVKALGAQLGRFVLVFCCDETFDFQAMGRIFIGLCQVGAWGCFDEFNRLEERMLSAVSQQIQSIQLGLKATATNAAAEIELIGRQLRLNLDTGIFITMNPGYAGRSNLPDNLKKLFRSVAMTRPDKELIAQVMLFSQGFRSAEALASKIVPFFTLCSEQLSSQPHYDFGLRALKAVLISAGHLKRLRLKQSEEASIDEHALPTAEAEIVIQSVTETIVPKLVAEDVPLLTTLLQDVFPGIRYVAVNLSGLEKHIRDVCTEMNLQAGEVWLRKALQLYQIQNIQHGVMMVGPSASGKSTAWRVLLTALERLEGVEGVHYLIDPKAISKEDLYGTLDSTTREWNDGLFTHILRKIVDNVRGESTKRHWIIFDGDVDPEWVENLNSVLDDNKLLTLPNGERLSLPPNVRVMFEVESLKYATLATVSRCGMVWFSDDTVSPAMLYHGYLDTLASRLLGSSDEDQRLATTGREPSAEVSPQLQLQKEASAILSKYFEPDALVDKALAAAREHSHIMDFTDMRAISTLFSLLNKAIRAVSEYNTQHSDFPLSSQKIEAYLTKRLLVGLVWAFSGDAKLEVRTQLGAYLCNQSGIDLPPLGPGGSLIDFDVQLLTGEWTSWNSAVPTIDIDTHAVLSADVVIPTVDTVRHEEVLYSWLSEHKPLLLCGPPGSGKTMTLFSALRKLPDMEVVGLNFSSATTPELLLKTFEQYCEYRKTPNGVVLSPVQIGRWLVIFCDEINLPATDKYGTQKVISFMRQLVEHNGYWRTKDKAWVRLERIQFVGACNPPTDPGRIPLSHRFLRHAPLVMVDYPARISLTQIYGTFNRALLKVVPPLRAYGEPLTAAMVDVYLASQARFTPDIQAHYIYSPRELTRWMRGIYEALRPLETLSVEGLVRIWAHEALRLFQDRLVDVSERQWTNEIIDSTASAHFPTIDAAQALVRPILFSNWTSKHYIAVDREDLREFVKARLRVFYEEELDVPLVLFDDVLDHVLRIDRVFRQTQGHMLLIGISGAGKTTLSRFVAWMNGLSIFQIKVHNKYKGEDFDEDLRTVLRRAGCKGEKICFIMDESNVLDSGFLERMNTLLANAEVPGLFEADEYSSLMTACKEGAQRDGLMLDSHEELYKWFTQQVAKNLHVVFTMNPPEAGLASKAATSPALFNRCVLDWFGDWPAQAFFQVGTEFTNALDLDVPSYIAPPSFPVVYEKLAQPPSHRSAIVNAFIGVHQSIYETNKRLAERQGRYNHVTPRHYLDFINQYVHLFNEKREDLEEQQRHLNVGLEKLRSTVVQVEELRKSLAVKRVQLEAKNAEANDKLQKMVSDQREAEQQKTASLQIQTALETQNIEIRERRDIVMADLAAAEPAVLDAQAAVSNIKKQHLTEVRSMANPPEAVKLAMESVCTVLGHQIDSWRTVQGIIRRDDFITSIVNFDTEHQMTKRLRDKMNADFLSKPAYNYENVNRASRACGPLVKWVLAQVGFSEILDRVGPLRAEVQSLEERAESTQRQASTILTMIGELETRIEQYKTEYAQLISETQAIKTEMEKVQSKVERSVTLLSSLESERDRWDTGSQRFEEQMRTIAGDVLLAAAFLAYSGYYDQQHRESLLQRWTGHLEQAGISYRVNYSPVEYLSSAEERLSWGAHSLPADDLSTENAIILKRFKRYPLIIDPSGQAVSFVMQEYKNRKIAVTSFLDEAFLKNLESALRFGTALLIQDVEHLDPILNTVLNRELRRAGGRVLIRLGNQDIDYSPAFTMFLSTRDPSADFAPDVCSRVVFANFTMTRSSLQSQSLSQILRGERPDTEKSRTDLVKLQGEFKAKLQQLERSLLQALNESTGNILDDDKVIDTLETLKQEAAEVTAKMEKTDTVMQEVEAVSSQYLPLASACSSIYFILEQLSLLNHFYQFSLRLFQDVFNYVLLHNPSLATITDPNLRLAKLTDDLFLHIYKRTARALLYADRIVLATLLAQIKLRGLDQKLEDEEVENFLDATSSLSRSVAAAPAESITYLSGEQNARLATLARLPAFKSIVQTMQEDMQGWTTTLANPLAEAYIPDLFANDTAPIAAFRKLLLVKALRPDRVLPAAASFANTVFSADLLAESGFELDKVVRDEVVAANPIAMCSIPGYDAAFRVENLVSASPGKTCVSVAMGSQEGYSLADQAISAAARVGNWVLLKNVHLAPSWLSQLEKRLQSMSAHPNFRLFLTLETNPSIPVNILRQSRIIMNEPPPGMRANLLESLQSITPERVNGPGPTERYRLYFGLAWLHAILVERLRYAPVGFTKTYEFNDSDQEAALSTIDTWMTQVAKGRSNLDPASIPFSALRSLLKQAIYGGRVDSEVDQNLLESFVDSLFTSAAYETGFTLVPESVTGEQALYAPEGNKMQDYIEWCRKLPEREPPSWLSLPPNSEQLLAEVAGKAYIASLRRMRSLSDEDETVTADVQKSTRPSWMRTAQSTCESLLRLLPSNFKVSLDAMPKGDPLVRFFKREVALGCKLLEQLQQDLNLLLACCKGELQQTNHIRDLIDAITKGAIPMSWQRYKVQKGISLNAWTIDFAKRLQALEKQASAGLAAPVWLGGLFRPSGWITASRQQAAHQAGVSLEMLQLHLEIGNAESDNSFPLEGLALQGATWNDGLLQANDGGVSPLPSVSLSWKESSAKTLLASGSKKYAFPVYLNGDRDVALFTASLKSHESTTMLTQRGVCMLAHL